MQINKLQNRKASVILSFSSEDVRNRFFETNCLEKYGISEKTMGTKTDCAVDDVKLPDLLKIISFAKNKFDADYHIDCAGRNLSDCTKYEKKCGNICSYCQYMELQNL
jgi:hypothetical protein